MKDCLTEIYGPRLRSLIPHEDKDYPEKIVDHLINRIMELKNRPENLGFGDELLADAFTGIELAHRIDLMRTFRDAGIALNDDGEKFAAFFVGGNHAVRMGGVQINAVSGIEDLNLVAQLDAQLSGKYEVKFLTGVR